MQAQGFRLVSPDPFLMRELELDTKSSVFSPEFIGQRAQIVSMTMPLILNVEIVSTKHWLHAYHYQ